MLKQSGDLLNWRPKSRRSQTPIAEWAKAAGCVVPLCGRFVSLTLLAVTSCQKCARDRVPPACRAVGPELERSDSDADERLHPGCRVKCWTRPARGHSGVAPHAQMRMACHPRQHGADMPTPSCCPGGQVWTIPLSRNSVSSAISCLRGAICHLKAIDFVSHALALRGASEQAEHTRN